MNNMENNSSAVQRQRGEVVYKILDTLSDIALTAPAAIVGILEAGYGASPASMEYHRNQNLPDLGSIRAVRQQRRREYQRYSLMIRYLKNKGLLKERKMGATAKLYLTHRGREKLAYLRRERKFDEGGRGYEASPGKKFIIVTYDIPEKKRKDRDWIRAVLRRIGLEYVQRSVWFGKVTIPDRFIEDLALRHITHHVEIVEVGSSGTIEHVL